MTTKNITLKTETCPCEIKIFNGVTPLKDFLDAFVLPTLEKTYGDIKNIIIEDKTIFKLETYSGEIPIIAILNGELEGNRTYDSIDAELCMICDNVCIGNNDYGIKPFSIIRRASQ